MLVDFFRNQNNKYMLTLNIGMTCMVIGFVLRILFGNNVSSVIIYSIMTLFLLLSVRDQLHPFMLYH